MTGVLALPYRQHGVLVHWTSIAMGASVVRLRLFCSGYQWERYQRFA
jgi:hypothetical protein